MAARAIIVKNPAARGLLRVQTEFRIAFANLGIASGYGQNRAERQQQGEALESASNRQ